VPNLDEAPGPGLGDRTGSRRGPFYRATNPVLAAIGEYSIGQAITGYQLNG